MTSASGIEWTDTTWSPVRGCTKVSAGCRDCWAKREADNRWSRNPRSRWFQRRFEDVTLDADALAHVVSLPAGSKVFVCPRSDLFHEAVPFEYIACVFAVMGLFPTLTFQLLTKRAQRMDAFLDWVACEGRVGNGAWHLCLMHLLKGGGDSVLGRLWKQLQPALQASEDGVAASVWPLPNVWLGVTAENQQALSERLPYLLRCSAALRWLSLEPLIGPVQLRHVTCRTPVLVQRPAIAGSDLAPAAAVVDALLGTAGDANEPGTSRGVAKVDWVVVGGERGPQSRPMEEQWLRTVIADCEFAGTPVFFKQWGDWIPRAQAPHRVPDIYPDVNVLRLGKRAAGALLDGRAYREFPAALPPAVEMGLERTPSHACV